MPDIFEFIEIAVLFELYLELILYNSLILLGTPIPIRLSIPLPKPSYRASKLSFNVLEGLLREWAESALTALSLKLL